MLASNGDGMRQVRWRLGGEPLALPQPRLCPQIYQSLLLRGLSLVGWYHSHPHSPALPSLQDIDSQMDYQLRLQGSSNGFQPCLALLCGKAWAARVRTRASCACVGRVRLCARARGASGPPTPPGRRHSHCPPAAPYYSGNPGPESKISPFWVMPPPEVGGAVRGGQGRGAAGQEGPVDGPWPGLWFWAHLGDRGPPFPPVKRDHNRRAVPGSPEGLDVEKARASRGALDTNTASLPNSAECHSPHLSWGQKSGLGSHSRVRGSLGGLSCWGQGHAASGVARQPSVEDPRGSEPGRSVIL